MFNPTLKHCGVLITEEEHKLRQEMHTAELLGRTWDPMCDPTVAAEVERLNKAINSLDPGRDAQYIKALIVEQIRVQLLHSPYGLTKPHPFKVTHIDVETLPFTGKRRQSKRKPVKTR